MNDINFFCLSIIGIYFAALLWIRWRASSICHKPLKYMLPQRSPNSGSADGIIQLSDLGSLKQGVNLQSDENHFIIKIF